MPPFAPRISTVARVVSVGELLEIQSRIATLEMKWFCRAVFPGKQANGVQTWSLKGLIEPSRRWTKFPTPKNDRLESPYSSASYRLKAHILVHVQPLGNLQLLTVY